MPMSRFARDVKDLKRFEQILLVLLKYRFGHFLKKTHLKKELPLKKRVGVEEFDEDSKPERLKEVFEELGATFVKLGQLLSLRQDLVPKEYCDEFAKLQDEVKPFPVAEAKKIIEAELKKPIESLFQSFDPEPLAAASIGQVHKAVLKSGREVVIKVQRPGIREVIESDLDIMYYIAHLIEKNYKNLLFDPVEIVKEFENYTRKELDYVVEGKNVEKFCKHFEGSKIIKIPKVYWTHTTNRVLTLEYIDGKKINEIKTNKKYSKKKITEHLVNAIFKQLFIDGFFHADPHPGNVLVLKNNVVALLDFGIVGFIDEDMKDKITVLFISMIKGDLEGIAEGLVTLDFTDYTVDMDILKIDLRDALGQYYDVSVKYVNMATLFPKIVELAKKHKIKLPSNFILLGKSLITTEGFCSELNPEFNLVKSARPFVQRLVKIRKSPKYVIKKLKRTSFDLKNFVVTLPEQSRELLKGIKDTDISFRSIDQDLQKLGTNIEKSGSRISLGIIIAALIVSSALIINVNKPKVFGISFYSFIGLIVAFFLILIFISNFIQYKRVK